ncbi:hypothetical protein [Snodgrassella sp. CFCC 13594]|uniref:hypothetical protein n=1 Tax=Snodgrassella sp. CFCC 13594 TaxID=1775559 RepID=UPI000831B13E|nr:hypothetical protein [Snodgrassella sp. CFCC 13594]
MNLFQPQFIERIETQDRKVVVSRLGTSIQAVFSIRGIDHETRFFRPEESSQKDAAIRYFLRYGKCSIHFGRKA